MKHQQKLLLSLLLVMFPPEIAYYFWNRIEGGAEAKALSKPYMAYLQGKNNHFCGGFLVAPNWVMTAAQCFNHKPLTVILGAQNIQKKEERWQTFEVQKYHRHPAYRILKGNATSNNYVKTISLQKQNNIGQPECTVAGWGYETPAAMLHETKVTILRSRECLNIYPGFPINSICTRSVFPGALRKGDIGGPLVCKNKAYGIFSYTYNEWYSYYTSISPYISWIDSVMKS
ncbi:PREDICTED: granzyme-like protein 1 [Tinamus guttatus]|uniref:granzyme-like protein 1 n=1 Tax=Tinamus guttatus TaxID=94827 RepID=UPI00052F33C7|nr:PREDICTED: granzyme-like protein 1 [Tinamus guttatus]